MSLIIKDKIPMFMKGYPTVSDKYNVSGGILTGSTPVKFGELVKHASTAGYFEAITTTVELADIAGFALATNVKLAEEWPARTVQINPGEAFNVLINGFIAVELDADASIANVPAVAAKAVASEDEAVVAGKTYYTRSSSSAGEGLLNDGTYAYTEVASPTGNPSTSNYYELSVLGSNAITDKAISNSPVYVILANGHLTTEDKASEGTVVQLPGCVFTGIKEIQGTAKLAEIYVK
jgi:hypothetical protein